ncbi:SRPBCC family protein [Streptomyces sp. ISL-100]|uniref:SRPBCC family protein n=1 Tax=Streptomyces sp. ISL-100 TaxID=2819173 RepID=UPI001BE78766|nr:SRPBCC family protein [Streptomyces sp. ISL-100]MBT2394858.1 SRPBCC family protein [Streptomyces sp. ISL-100]
MTDSRNPLAGDAGARLMEELQQYLQARAERTVATMGRRLGEATKQLAEPDSSVSGTLGTLAKGGKALGQGKSPARAAGAMGLSKLTSGIKEKVTGLFGMGGKGGKGETRAKSVVIIEDIDIGVPVEQAYNQWTELQKFSRFAKGVVNVEKTDQTNYNWQVKVAKAGRSWKAKVTEQIPDERIVWTSEGAKGTTKGVVTFHPLGDNLTKVLLVVEYFPKGLVEKTGNLVRAQGRRVRLDLKLFRKFVTMQDEAAEGWRGEIRDAEVVREGEDEDGRREAEAESDEQDEGDDGEEEDQDGSWDESERWEEDEEPEEEPARARKAPKEAADEEDEIEEEEEEDEEPYEQDAEPYSDEEPYEEERPRRRAASRR